MPRPTKSLLFLPLGLLFVLCACSPLLAQDPPRKDQTKTVWTNDELERLASRPPANAPGSSSADKVMASSGVREPYSRQKDPKWYSRQLQPLREALAKTENELKALQQARKYGKGVTGAVSLDQEPEGVTSEGQIEALEKRRSQLLGSIDELEEEARHNAILPGELTVEPAPEGKVPRENSAEGSDNSTADKNEANSNPEIKELKTAIADEKEHLEHARKEAELLRRDRELKKQQVYSNPDASSRRSKLPELGEISGRLAEKQAEVQETEQRIADLEDRLEDLRQNPPAESETEAGTVARSKSAVPSPENEARDEKNETHWRKQFAAIDYKIRIAQTELDILQREHNLGLVQYYSNPATAMKESIRRRAINEHRKAIEDKKKEVADLKRQRADLEDQLRHAGAPAGWARD